MSRGKYGDKAAKRQETQALEAEVAKLQRTLDRVTKERDETKTALEQIRISAAAERKVLLADAETGASPKLRLVEATLAEERHIRAQEREMYARRVFEMLAQNGVNMEHRLGWAALAELFGQGHRLGELISGGGDDPRRVRRVTARTSRIIGDMNAAPEWAKAPAKAAGK